MTPTTAVFSFGKMDKMANKKRTDDRRWWICWKKMFFFPTRAAFSHFSSFSSTSKFCQNLVWGEMGINWRNTTNKWMHQKDWKQLQTTGFANSLTALMGRSSSFSKNQLRFKQPYQTASHSRSRGREANQSQQQVSRLLGAGSFFAFFQQQKVIKIPAWAL